jgi:hypothetical protein
MELFGLRRCGYKPKLGLFARKIEIVAGRRRAGTVYDYGLPYQPHTSTQISKFLQHF